MRRQRARAQRVPDPEPISLPPLESSSGGAADPLARCDATAQAELVRRREVSPAELVEAALARIERVDPCLGAVVATLAEEARAAARGPLREGPFRGVPFLLKDLGARQAGLPYWAGNRTLCESGYRAPADTLLGARFRSLGLVTVGKSKTPEFGLQSTTQPLAFGPTRNPFDPECSAGGSSGGSCAAVAAGLVPVAHASDGAGSIRIPAAWCGLVGLKPSKGRIAGGRAGGGEPELEFVVARSLRDTTALFEALALRGQLPARGRLGPLSLRVGVVTRSPAGATDPACIAAVHEAARLLGLLGHRVEASAPAALFEYEERALQGAVLGPPHFRECLENLAALLGRAVGPDDVEPFLWEIAQLGTDRPEPLRIAQAIAAHEWLRGWERRMAAWWRGFDLLVTPTVPVPAARLAELDGEALEPLELLGRLVPHMAFTEPFNATGQPALSLPLGWTEAGLPVGVQLVAARGRDELLLEVAARLEEAASAPARTPRIHA